MNCYNNSRSFADTLINGKSYVPLAELTPYGFDKTRLEDASLIVEIDGTEYLCLGECPSEDGYAALKYRYNTGNEIRSTVDFTIMRNFNVEDVEINEENFPDETFRRRVSQYDTNGDGKLSAKELAYVSNLWLNDQSITTLKGIEHFYALTGLDVSNCGLTSLNLSKNTALQSLYCSDNSLIALDLSNNTNLQWLDCSNNRRSLADTLINGKSYVPLAELTPYGFDKTRLEDASLVVEIEGTEYLCLGECTSEKDITALTYRYNTGNSSRPTAEFTITRIADVEDVEINEENFPDETFRRRVSRYDTNGDGKLSAEELAYVSNINVGDQNITTLKGIEHFYALTELYADNCGLISLDLSKNTMLQNLNCNNNRRSLADTLINGKSYVPLAELTPYGFDKTRLEDASLVVEIEGTEYLCLGECPSENSYASLTYRYNTGNEIRSTVNFTIMRNFNAEDVEINEENFPDNTFRNYVSQYDADGNGILSGEERFTVSSLWFDNQSITTLKGIEHFYALTELYAPYCGLTTLDLSKNTALQGLYCSENNLIALNLSNNTNLQWMDCNNNSRSFADTLINGKSYVPLAELTPYGFDKTRLEDASPIVEIDGTEYLCLGECPSENSYASLTYRYNTGNEPNFPTVEFTIMRNFNAEDVEINEENFPDERFRSEVYMYDTNGDGKLSTQELANTSFISFSNDNITTLKGIEHFFALTELSIYNCGLTSLDISKNTMLQNLNCTNNSLIALDLSNNTNLQWMYCDNNSRSFADVLIDGKSYVPLSELTPYGFDKTRLEDASLIVEIDGTEYLCLGECPSEDSYAALTYRYNTGNENFPTVEFTIMRNFNAEDVEINEENFPDETFRNYVSQYDTDGNGILSGEERATISRLWFDGQSITTLKGIEHFYALTELTVNNCGLLSLDLSKNTALQILYCSYNSLTALDLSKNTALQLLYCGYNNLTALDLSKNTNLQYVGCYYNSRSFDDVLIDGKSYVPLSELTPYGFDKTRLEDASLIVEIDGTEYFCIGECESVYTEQSRTYGYYLSDGLGYGYFTIKRNAEVLTDITLNAYGYATYSNRETVTLDGATAYTATVDEAASVTWLTPIGNVVPANTGVLLMGDANAEVSVTLGGNEPFIGSNDLHPTLSPEKPEGNVFVLKGEKFVKFVGTELSVNKAHLIMSDGFGLSAASAPLRMVIGSDPSRIRDVKAETSAEAPTYNLNGQRVDSTAKGIVIRNGKKVINK